MRCTATASIALSGVIVVFAANARVNGEEIPAQYKACIEKGLNWLAKQQDRDGRWTSNGQYPVSMTALSGIALLMQGSTLRNGKYSDRLVKAVDWLTAHSLASGLIGDLQVEGSYMYGHGFAMLFLASVYGEEDNILQRNKLEDVLTRAVIFSGRAQGEHGDWCYVSASDAGGRGVDSSSTVTQMQGLRAARNAGIVVPKEIIDKGMRNLRETTAPDGGVCYGRSNRRNGEGGRPPLTAAAIASCFAAGEYRSKLVKTWIRYCEKCIPLSTTGRLGHDEYTHCYLAQVAYSLSEEGYGKLFPESRLEERLTWSRYRKLVFDNLMRSQSEEGNWNNTGWGIGAVYATAMHLIILQLDNATLPIFQR